VHPHGSWSYCAKRRDRPVGDQPRSTAQICARRRINHKQLRYPHHHRRKQQRSYRLGDYNKSFGSYENKDFLTTAIDYHISEKDQIRGRYIYNLADGPDTAAVLPVFWGTAPNRYHLASISEFHTFTPNLLNEARLGYSRYFGKIDAPYPAEFPGLGTFPNIVLEDLNFLQIGPDPNAPSGGVQNTYELSDNVSYSKGKHSFKLGFDGRKYISPQYFTQRVRGDYDYTNSELYLTDGVPDDGANATQPLQAQSPPITAMQPHSRALFRMTGRYLRP